MVTDNNGITDVEGLEIHPRNGGPTRRSPYFLRGDRARGDRATAAVGPGVRQGSGGRGGGVQAQPQQRDGRSGSDFNQGVLHALGALVTQIIPQMQHPIRELQTQMLQLTTHIAENQRNMAAMGDQHQRTLNLIVSLESRVARLERQIRASEEDE
ncbi:hypothetical protein ACHAWC_000683 [Mediolabrus comicus]